MWLLIAPIVLTIDSMRLCVELRWWSIGHMHLLTENGRWTLKFRVWFYSKQLLIDSMGRKASGKNQSRHRKKKTGKSLRKWMNTALHVLKTFRISQCTVSVDTGDAVMNSWMHIGYVSPLIRNHVNINYSSQNKVFIQVRNRPIRILYAFVNSYFLN
jgi:hypothetical protein